MALTSADLDNGKLDLQTIEDVVNSASTSPVVSRLGNSINTLSAASAAIQANVDAVDAVAAQEIATVTAAGDQAVSDIQSESTQASDAITTARTDAVASINADVATVDVAKSSAITQFQENAREVGYNEVVAWSSGVLYNDFRVLVTNGGLTYKLRIEHTSTGSFATDLAAGKWLIYEPTALGTAAERDAATSGTPTSGLVDAALGFWGMGASVVQNGRDLNDVTGVPNGMSEKFAFNAVNLPPNWLGVGGKLLEFRDSAITSRVTQLLINYADNQIAYRAELIDPWVELYHTGNYQPETTNGLGVVKRMQYINATGIADGATTAGSNLRSMRQNTAGAVVATATPAGTWKNVTGTSIFNNEIGDFVRIA